MSKAEEKAKEYNSWRTFVSDHQLWTPALEKACKIAEKQGYNKAKKELSSETVQLKEALREIINKSYGIFIRTNTSTSFDYYNQFDKARTKAEQLLKKTIKMKKELIDKSIESFLNKSVFPVKIDTQTGEVQTLGLTKRELFAAMAMQGMLADPNVTNFELCTKQAVECADALINELNKSN